MTIRLAADGSIVLEGICPLEEAETLLQYLLAAPDAVVDWRACVQIHTAIVQILLASRAPLRGSPSDAFLRDHLDPEIRRRLDQSC